MKNRVVHYTYEISTSQSGRISFFGMSTSEFFHLKLQAHIVADSPDAK